MLASPIGHYQSGNSLIHHLDPRTKLVATIVFIITLFTLNRPAQLLVATLGLVALVVASQLSARNVIQSVKPIVPFALVVALFNLFVVQGGATLAALGIFTITEAGAWAALLYTARLLMAVALGALLLLTTTPTALTDAFEALLSPLSCLGMPIHEISMVLSLALRFVPILADETQSVIDAQAARGGSIEDGTLSERIQALSSIMVAVFAGALRHAQNLSRALDARCYEGGEHRTHYRELCLKHQDALFICLCAAWIVFVAFI